MEVTKIIRKALFESSAEEGGGGVVGWDGSTDHRLQS
jgi:hypothetical protein